MARRGLRPWHWNHRRVPDCAGGLGVARPSARTERAYCQFAGHRWLGRPDTCCAMKLRASSCEIGAERAARASPDRSIIPSVVPKPGLRSVFRSGRPRRIADRP